jgi:hypothetical protein
MTTQRSRHPAAPPRSPSNGRSSRASGLLGRHEVDPATAYHFPRRRPSPSRRLRWPSRPAPASIARFPSQAVESRSWTLQATPSPAIAAVRLPAPPPPSTTSRSDTVDTGTRGHRTPHPWTPDGGHRTLRRPHRTPDSSRVTGTRGHWTLAPDSGHRTPDAGRGRGHGDEGTAGIHTFLGRHAQRRRVGRPTVFLGTALAALGNHDGAAVGHLRA